MTAADFSQPRQQMLALIAAKTIRDSVPLGKAALDSRVTEAMAQVPRHAFVPFELQPLAYDDSPLPIGCGKTISQPFIVAVMTDLLDLRPTDTVLEIGTGLGYQTAVLAQLARYVYSVERIEALAVQARCRLALQGYANIEIRVGNGYAGWPEHAPFDKVIVTAAPERVPPALLEQLAPGGRLAIPAGPPGAQQLLRIDKDAGGRLLTQEILPVCFSLLEDAEAG